jgi:transposase-like protein
MPTITDQPEPVADLLTRTGDSANLLDDLVREGARRMLAAALQAEVDAYIAAHTGDLDDQGHRLVVRNGHHQPRTVTTSAGAIEVRAPRVNDRRHDENGRRHRFASSILPAWARTSPKIAEVLPLLYLHGLSTNDFAPALRQFLGSDAGLSPAVIQRTTTTWQQEAKTFQDRDLHGVDYVYMWVDGVWFNVRLADERTCLLVMIGVRADGAKELIGLQEGFRESSESWADLLRDCRRRGMRDPVLAVGDGALGFWDALGQVFASTRAQRCTVHKTRNVLASLPKSQHPGAKKAMAEIWNASDKDHARAAARAFARTYGVKWPKAAAKITGDLEDLLAFYDFPAEHWAHLKTTNPIESTFATVRLRTHATKGPGSRDAGVAMAFKLIESAQARWRRITGPELVALVRAGVEFHDGVRVERPDAEPADMGSGDLSASPESHAA